MEVKSCLASVTFPLDKQSIVKYATEHCKIEQADALMKIKEKQYASAEEVDKEVGM